MRQKVIYKGEIINQIIIRLVQFFKNYSKFAREITLKEKDTICHQFASFEFLLLIEKISLQY